MADVLAVRDEYRAQQWAILIQECKASGMSNKEFCIQRGVSEKSFEKTAYKASRSSCTAVGTIGSGFCTDRTTPNQLPWR